MADFAAHHWAKLATKLRELRPNSLSASYVTWNIMAHGIADLLEADNAHFKRADFLDACGMDGSQ